MSPSWFTRHPLTVKGTVRKWSPQEDHLSQGAFEKAGGQSADGGGVADRRATHISVGGGQLKPQFPKNSKTSYFQSSSPSCPELHCTCCEDNRGRARSLVFLSLNVSEGGTGKMMLSGLVRGDCFPKKGEQKQKQKQGGEESRGTCTPPVT